MEMTSLYRYPESKDEGSHKSKEMLHFFQHDVRFGIGREKIEILKNLQKAMSFLIPLYHYSLRFPCDLIFLSQGLPLSSNHLRT
jgi:hypothetical protein